MSKLMLELRLVEIQRLADEPRVFAKFGKNFARGIVIIGEIRRQVPTHVPVDNFTTMHARAQTNPFNSPLKNSIL